MSPPQAGHRSGNSSLTWLKIWGGVNVGDLAAIALLRDASRATTVAATSGGT
jgi:hypothetical protein